MSIPHPFRHCAEFVRLFGVRRRKPLRRATAKILAAAALCAFAQCASAAPSAAVTPYTFIGRLTDSRHAGFDTNRVCTLSAYNDNGDLIAETQSTYRNDTRDNYVLKVPVATHVASGYAVQADALTIAARDDTGKVWQGVIPDALCGEAGGLRRVDIVLGEDQNGDNIDDALFAELRAQWEASDYWRFGEEFDPSADHDGDGVPTIDEVYAGTNPYDPEDSLVITSFNPAHPATRGTRGAATESRSFALTFPAIPGRAYSIESTTSLVSTNVWTTTPFTRQGSDIEETAIAISSSGIGSVVPVTIYLLPADDAARFYRVHIE